MSTGEPAWARLLRVARLLIRQVNSDTVVVDSWSLGGGTAMMLQIDHRESHDIDIFLTDPQYLRCFDPALHDFQFEIRPSDCRSDGSGFLKLAFENIGEIDFIVARALTESPTTTRTIEGEEVELEAIAEVITKKIHHRAGRITPRDIFDIAAAAKHDRKAIVGALKMYRNDVTETLNALGRLNPDFIDAAIGALAIKDRYRSLAATALHEAKALLRSV